jgi:hypothetical protein
MSFTNRKTPWQAGDLLVLKEENEFGAYSPDLQAPVLGVYGRYKAGTPVVFLNISVEGIWERLLSSSTANLLGLLRVN